MRARGPPTATHEGLREKGKASRAGSRSAPGFGKRRTDWGKHALAAYTWTRTEKGPQRSWLHRIGKANDPACHCGHPTQDGTHLVFHCPRLSTERANLLPPDAHSWEELDDPHWVTEEGGEGGKKEKFEGIEDFFQKLYWKLRRAREQEEEGDD